MMQEHPFFSRPQIFYGNPVDEDEDDAEEEILWPTSLGEMQKNSQEKIGLFLFWFETSPDEIHFS